MAKNDKECKQSRLSIIKKQITVIHVDDDSFRFKNSLKISDGIATEKGGRWAISKGS